MIRLLMRKFINIYIYKFVYSQYIYLNKLYDDSGDDDDC